MMTEELETIEQVEEVEENRSFNHSYICTEILLHVSQNKDYKPMVESTLDIGKGLTPDISVYPKDKIRPNFFKTSPNTLNHRDNFS
jgi:hypothetical protein